MVHGAIAPHYWEGLAAERRACIDGPSARLRAWADELNETISFIRAESPGPPAELEDATSAMFAERVALLLRVLTHMGEPGETAAVRAGVLGAVEDPSVRDLVRNHLGSAA